MTDNKLTVRINMDIIEQFDRDEMLVIGGGLRIFGIDLCFNNGHCPTTNTVAQCGCSTSGSGSETANETQGTASYF